MTRALFCCCQWFVLTGICLGTTFAQNLPPLIGTEIKNPGIHVPNPMEQVGAQRQTTNNQSSPTRVQESEIAQFLEGVTSAYSHRDRERILTAYAQDPELIVAWDGALLAGVEKFDEALEPWLKQFDILAIELKQPKVHVMGRMAWISSSILVRASTQGTENLKAGTVTWMLEKKRATWVIVHEHRTLLPNPVK
ncbi:MAG: nuclear transport factor 2 family protein [Terriglobia bacterium]